ncbi:hypothetical protein [Commensalibacter nepenthis]|uniref:Uncharacterized protein n=1 Tax=Commensalibacter nepenthis TaxID=3043872 RepID=A0ABT6QAN8_9PROT|nr:hypothetical protein [Commensalibacter sp. TBRC 10068]MDI2113313.1 hypothetical protein [Commensalibacter sp. TBRC 10068]
MSDEYQLIISSPLPDHFFAHLASKINTTTTFHAFDVTSYSICCIHKTQAFNKEILKWGGHFNLYHVSGKIILTINGGNITNIKTIIIEILQQLNIDLTLSLLEE